eukprot:TRINITY_DN751_c0_g1_i2.p1 TRINITY_DN751_c0_g1~~TRINITY_DN751_c0_g1_i2.p1  ORF type:complete len:325 (+),score=12.81 TRINITY_DN751_c0_g1_i2:97-1071(+)
MRGITNVTVPMSNNSQLFYNDDNGITTDLLEVFDAVHLHGQAQQQDNKQFFNSRVGNTEDYDPELKDFMAVLDQPQTQSQGNNEEFLGQPIQMSKMNENIQKRNYGVFFQMGQAQYYHPQNLYQIREGICQQQNQLDAHVIHNRSYSDSASNSSVGIQNLLSADYVRTPVPQVQSPMFADRRNITQQHRRARSDQLPSHGASELTCSAEMNKLFNELLRSYTEQEQIESYFDATATQAALGHVYGTTSKQIASHRRIHSYDSAPHCTQYLERTPSMDFVSAALQQSYIKGTQGKIPQRPRKGKLDFESSTTGYSDVNQQLSCHD